MKKIITMMTITTLLAGVVVSQGLFFSEYIEGSSNNKALEIYNPTDQVIDLSDYAFPNVSNAPTVPGEYEYWNTFDAGATIDPGGVYVITHGSADPLMLAVADMNFNYLSNGDDGFCLVQGTESSYTVLDCIGDWNGDPGSGWDVAGEPAATKDHTLVRKDTITQGNPDWASSAGTDADNSEWIVYPQNTFDYLGWHITPPTGNWGCDDPDALNYNANADGCEDGTSSCCDYPVAATIHEIQGEMDASPFAGMGVITSGIVTGVTGSGLFLQDGDGAWNGIWCYLGSGNTDGILIGDNIEIVGMVTEYYDLTEIEGDVTVLSSGNALPNAEPLTTGGVTEAYEGVLISFSNAVCDNDSLGYGEWSVDDGSGSIVLDDKMYTFTPTQGTAYDITGVVDYSYGAYKVQPRDAADIVESGGASTVMITFQVDMQYQDVSPDGVHIAGGFQGWDPAASECTLVSDAIYATTFELTPGDYHEYKFINGNAWGSDEAVQRNITVPDVDTVLDPVFFNDYVDQGLGPVSITFQVDMQYQDVSPDGVHIAGAFQGWDPAADECTLVSDAIYAATFVLNPGEYHEYKFINGNAWGSDESVQRNITVPDVDTVLDPVYFNDYVDLGGGPVNVTFHLNTSTMPGYTDSTNTIVIRGSFNGWGGNEWEVVNVGGDYWSFTTAVPLEPGNYEYKYVNITPGGDEWESVDNRALEVTGVDGDQDQPIDYFNAAGPPYVETDGIDVYFRVCTLGIAAYGGEDMYVAGSFEGWSGTLMVDEGTGDYWGLSYSFDTPSEVEYKFQDGPGGWESSIDNRYANITQDTTLAFKYWNDQAPIQEEPVTKTVIFQTDMTEWLDEAGATGMPVFSLARNDTMEVRGGFNGWNDNDVTNSVMVRQPGTNIFSLPISITNYPSITMEYKYFIKHSAESMQLFEEQYGPMYADMGWEDSPQFGGSNRTFSLGGSDNEIYQLPLAGYYDLPAGGTIPAGQQIVATYTVDMNAADASGFVPGDEVRLVLKDKWNNYLQGFGNEFTTVATDNGDGTYSAQVTLIGPAPWHTIYAWEFEGVDFSLQEGGGFGFGRFRARYMCPNNGAWGDWSYPTDTWTEEPPLYVEDYQSALECLGVCVADGDVTGDGSLDVLDIVAVVSHVLGINPIADDMVCHADMDTNDTIDILDIVIMVDIILNQGGRVQSEATQATIINRNGAVSIESDGFIGGVQMRLSHGDSFSLTMADDAYLADSYTDGNETVLIVVHPSGLLFSTSDTFGIQDYTVVNSQDYIPATIAGSYALLSSYPNPFNPVTEISYYLPESGQANVSVYNMLGQRIAELANGNVESGNYSVKWNGTTASGEQVPSGIYFVKLRYPEGVKTHKITLLK